LEEYRKAGVREYLVIAVLERQVNWFARRGERFAELAPGEDGVLRSEVFPGLWLHPEGFFARRMSRLLSTALRGRTTPEHAAFVAELAARRKKTRPAGKRLPRKNK
jgi:hypothetical protein